jgi:hypothetical protein
MTPLEHATEGGGRGVGPREMVDNLEKELKMRSIIRLSDTILRVKWAI